MEEDQKVQHVADHDSEQLEDKDTPSVDQMTSQQKLFYFAKQGLVKELRELGTAGGFDINARDDSVDENNPYKSLNTALHYAVMSGSQQTVEVCFNLEAKLEKTNKLESTALHLAAAHGYLEITRYLVEKKANLDATNKVQNKPLHCAVYAGHVDIVKYLLSQMDNPKDALLETNGVGMPAVKYTAHDKMKDLLRGYFPKQSSNASQYDQDEQKVDAPEDNNTSNPTVVEEEGPM